MRCLHCKLLIDQYFKVLTIGVGARMALGQHAYHTYFIGLLKRLTNSNLGAQVNVLGGHSLALETQDKIAKVWLCPLLGSRR